MTVVRMRRWGIEQKAARRASVVDESADKKLHVGQKRQPLLARNENIPEVIGVQRATFCD